MDTILFACTKCFSKHPFKELSKGDQLCRGCRGDFPAIKCTYCRAEFHPENQADKTTIELTPVCKKCEQMVKQYGKPSACEHCNIISAFIGNKCQRCTNSEKKYGSPVTCDSCRQKCAFDRQAAEKRSEGKVMCWLCTMTHKNAKEDHSQKDHRKRNNSSKHASKDRKRRNSSHERHEKKKQRLDPSRQTPITSDGSFLGNPENDINSSDHVIALTQLREEVASMKRTITAKDALILEKDKRIAELKAENLTKERDLRGRYATLEKKTGETIKDLQNTNLELRKSVGQLTRQCKEKTKGGTGSPFPKHGSPMPKTASPKTASPKTASPTPEPSN